LLHRALFWAAKAEASWPIWNTSNPNTETAVFTKKKKLVVINNVGEPQETTVTLGDGRSTRRVKLDAHGIAILDT